MLGLAFASIWSWAIIIDKVLLFGRVQSPDRPLREGVLVGPVARGPLSLACRAARPSAMAALFVAAMREWKRSFEAGARSPIGLQMRIDRVLDVTIAPRERAAGEPAAVPRHRRLGRSVHRPVRHRLGHHGLVPGDRRLEEHLARRRGARHRRGADGDRARPRSPPFPPSSPTTSCRARPARSPAASRASPTKFSAILSRQIDERA